MDPSIGSAFRASTRARVSHIHDDVCRRGYDVSVGAFVQYYGSKDLDASLLMMPLVGFLPVTDPRVQSTVHAIQRDLVIDEGFVLRYQNDHSLDCATTSGSSRRSTTHEPGACWATSPRPSRTSRSSSPRAR
jgi:GH15 family glucan-1,4-alpha-glucosidase